MILWSLFYVHLCGNRLMRVSLSFSSEEDTGEITRVDKDVSAEAVTFV